MLLFGLLAILPALAAASPVASASATLAPGCTGVTKTAVFDHLPTGTIDPKADHGGLHYSGWEVVAAKDTVFHAHSGRKVLRLIDDTGSISIVDTDQYYNDHGTPASPSFYFGCQTATESFNCGFSKLYNVSGAPTYYGFFNSTAYPKTLEAAGGIEPINTQLITWGLANGAGSKPGPNLHLYIDSYRYTLSNCQS